MTDLFSLLLIVLPLYPKTVNGYIYSVSLSAYTEATTLNRMAYWILFLALILTGILKILLNTTEKKQDAVTACSMVLGALTVLLLALAGETYAVAMAFLLLLVKGALLMKTMKQKSF